MLYRCLTCDALGCIGFSKERQAVGAGPRVVLLAVVDLTSQQVADGHRCGPSRDFVLEPEAIAVTGDKLSSSLSVNTFCARTSPKLLMLPVTPTLPRNSEVVLLHLIDEELTSTRDRETSVIIC